MVFSLLVVGQLSFAAVAASEVFRVHTKSVMAQHQSNKPFLPMIVPQVCFCPNAGFVFCRIKKQTMQLESSSMNIIMIILINTVMFCLIADGHMLVTLVPSTKGMWPFCSGVISALQ